MNDTPQSTPAVPEDLAALSAQKWAWMSDRDTEALGGLFHEDAIFVHMGATFSREQELDVIGSGGIHYRDVVIHEASARIIATTGIVLSDLVLTAVVDEQEVTNPFAVTEVYVDEDGSWRLVAMTFTRLIGRPES